MPTPFRRADCSRLRAALCAPAPCSLSALADVTLCCAALTNALVLELLSHAKQLGTPNVRVAELLLSRSCVLRIGLGDAVAVARELRTCTPNRHGADGTGNPSTRSVGILLVFFL
jgi:hypothetical protein